MCHLLLVDKNLLGGSVDSVSYGPVSSVFDTPKLTAVVGWSSPWKGY